MAKLMIVNPKKRRKAKRKTGPKKAVARRRVSRAPAKRRVRRRRNPAARGYTGKIITSFQDGAVGSLGAIAGTLAGNFLPLPDQLKTGNMAVIIQALIGVSVGITVGNVAKNKKLGMDMAKGSVTVALHDTMKNLLKQAMPTLQLDGYGDGLLGMDEYVLSEYVKGNDLGYMSPAMNAGGSGGGYENANESLL